jgi:hypothetical protein
MECAVASNCAPIFIAHGFGIYEEVQGFNPLLQVPNCAALRLELKKLI